MYRKLSLLVLLATLAFSVSAESGIIPLNSTVKPENVNTTDKKTTNNQALRKWPRLIAISNADITVYQPQLESLNDNKLSVRAAVAVKRHNKPDTSYCAVWMTALLDVNKETRIVRLRDIKITKIAYPDVSEKVKESLGGIIRRNLLKADLNFSLDRLIAMMNAIDKKKKQDSEFKNTPPKFFLSTKPSILVLINGKPVLKKVSDSVEQVLNTTYVLFKSGEKYYLHAAGRWFLSDKLTKDWKYTKTVPEEINELLKKSNPDPEDLGSGDIPAIYVSTEPAELIQSYGEPVLATIPGTNLSYLKNSDNDIFRDEKTSKLYLLVSGRWFTADRKEGPWKYVPSDKLPEDFKKIPDSSPKANVLASIAGTPEAEDAAMESYIPQTATVKRGKVKIDVKFDGQPIFKPVDGTRLEYAVNTEDQVIKFKDKYYLCRDAIWYVSDSPTAEEWDVCVNVPEEIYQIPPDNPLYNTTYAKVYDYDDDYVDVGYTPGYLGSFVLGGVVIYGTGCWYKWWCQNFRCPRPATYGAACRYNIIKSCWERYDRYRDKLGDYVEWNNNRMRGERRPSLANGDYRGKRPSTEIGNRQNLYRGNKNIVRSAVAASAIRKNMIAKRPGAKPVTPVKRPAARPVTNPVNRPSVRPIDKPNNIYVGKDGSVYKHGLNGWQKYSGGKWSSVAPGTRPSIKPTNKPTTRPATRPSTRPSTRPAYKPSNHISPSTKKYLQKHYSSRQRGNYRTNRSRHYSRSRSTRSYRSRSGGRSMRSGRGGRR